MRSYTGRPWVGTIFSEAHLSGADFTEAAIWKAHLADVDLSDAEGLEASVHRGLSTVGIDTIYKSRGKIPDVFLRGCGVPDGFIAYIGSMVGRPIEYYSCFISRSAVIHSSLGTDLNAHSACYRTHEDVLGRASEVPFSSPHPAALERSHYRGEPAVEEQLLESTHVGSAFQLKLNLD